MTPGARVAAATEIIDNVIAGAPVEKALTGWARASRFAGSKDRRAIRDHVFGVVRRWWSTAWVGGGETARARLHGALLMDGIDPAAIFTGDGHAPAPLTEAEMRATRDLTTAPDAVRADFQPWVLDLLTAERGAATAMEIAQALRHRAALHLRANLVRGTRTSAKASLLSEGIATNEHPIASTALEVTEGGTRVSASTAFAEGLVEPQDAASQAVVEGLGAISGVEVLDFCAGGGGKSLALAALGARVTAFDIDPTRMTDLPRRTARAGVVDKIACVSQPKGCFDLVLVDAPCSGSGAWRRQPEAKLRLTPERLTELNAMQDNVLKAAADHVAPNGRLAYATCSLLKAENDDRTHAFCQTHPEWRVIERRDWSPLDGCDGFFLSILTRA